MIEFLNKYIIKRNKCGRRPHLLRFYGPLYSTEDNGWRKIMNLSKIGGIIAVANNQVARPLLQVGAIPIIRRIVITYQQVGVFPIVVVVGGDDDELKRELSALGVIFLKHEKNETPELMDSVREGLEYLKGKCSRVVFTPVNVPMFTPDTLQRLLDAEGEIVAPSCQGKGGHPIVISDEVIPQIMAYSGEKGLRGAMEDLPRTWVDVEDKGILTNVHNQEELNQQLEGHNFSILHPALHMKLEQEEPFFSARLKLLLYLIEDTNNMRTACTRSGVSHSKAWDMINRLERSLGYSVVERQRGGKAGGSTRLTPQGADFLVAYQEFEQAVHQFAQKEFKKRFIFTKIIE